MEVRMFAVQDIPAGAFHPPFVAGTEGVALRLLSNAVNQQGHMYNMHPGDYIVYEIGSYDDVTAMVTPCAPRRICQLVALIKTGE